MNLSILLVGLIAQSFYTARMLVQWFKTEKSHRIESPALFWIFSLLGSVFLFLYGYLRADFSIVLGEFLSFYIYIWNLKAKGCLSRQWRVWVRVLYFFPIGVLCFFLKRDVAEVTAVFFHNADLPLWALCWGIMGQLVYKMRFVYQWYYSHARRESTLPLGFWWISLVGTFMIIVYGIYRADPVLIIGQVGIIPTIRNLVIGHRYPPALPHTHTIHSRGKDREKL